MFGGFVINCRTNTNDLGFCHMGEIMNPRRRKCGHRLSIYDMWKLVDPAPEIITVGTGISKGVMSDKGFE